MVEEIKPLTVGDLAKLSREGFVKVKVVEVKEILLKIDKEIQKLKADRKIGKEMMKQVRRTKK